ncbi:unnamed protein product [Protopolystoma xenopodis]|uniref:Uncharacterized protein n=1 Tax=Protopolystoma xenopodis TaxID=117903 RepID=A0A448XNX1_9PLAT|nr:unnamed protein product [Protopolystoma xenopodis]
MTRRRFYPQNQFILDAEGPSDGPSRSKKKRLRRKRNRQLELSCLYNLDLGTSSNSAKILRGDVESSAKVTMVEEILTDECKEDVRPVVGDVVAKPRLSKYRQKANAPQDYSPSRHKHEQIRDIPKDDDYRGKRAIAVTIKQDKLTDKKSKRDNLLISDARLKAAGIDPKFYRYGKIHKSMKNPEDLAAD